MTAAARARAMPRSAIREIMALAAGRSDVIHLEVGEPDAGTPAAIVAEAFARVRDGATRYTPNAGLAELRQRIAARVAARLGQAVGADSIVVTTGAIGALFTAIFAVADPGDEVLIPDPGWPNYESICHLAGARPVRYAQPAASGFLPDPAAIEALVGPRTRAILINTPGNPSGAVFPPALMAALGDIAARHGLWLISDEIYEDIVFDGRHVSAAAAAPSDRVILISGFSKSYAMTGWRLGYLVVPPELAAVCAGLQEPITSCPAAPSQAAGIAALDGPQDVVTGFRDTFRRRRDLMLEVFDGTGLVPARPAGAFYGLVDIGRSGLDSVRFAKALLTERGVATVPGITFGPSCDRFVRVAFTIADAPLREGLTRLRDRILGNAG